MASVHTLRRKSLRIACIRQRHVRCFLFRQHQEACSKGIPHFAHVFEPQLPRVYRLARGQQARQTIVVNQQVAQRGANVEADGAEIAELRVDRLQAVIGDEDRAAVKSPCSSAAAWVKKRCFSPATAMRSTTLDRQCASGLDIPIEQHAASEATGVADSFGIVLWALENADVFNPAFDVTPAALISGWVLDTGVETYSASRPSAAK